MKKEIENIIHEFIEDKWEQISKGYFDSENLADRIVRYIRGYIGWRMRPYHKLLKGLAKMRRHK